MIRKVMVATLVLACAACSVGDSDAVNPVDVALDINDTADRMIADAPTNAPTNAELRARAEAQRSDYWHDEEGELGSEYQESGGFADPVSADEYGF